MIGSMYAVDFAVILWLRGAWWAIELFLCWERALQGQRVE